MGLFSFGKSSSRSSSSSFGASQGSTFVDPTQAPFLDFLRNAGISQFGQQQDQLGQFAGQSQALFQQGQQALGGLTDNPFLSALGGQAGGNPDLVAAQTGQLSDVLAQQFTEQINPAITSESIRGGQLGGGRQGVAQGAAIQGQQRALAAGNVGFQAADAARAQQAALGGGQLFGQGAEATQAALPGLQGLLAAPFGQQLQSLLGLGQAIGGPTTLSQQSAFDRSRSSGSSSGFNIGFGSTPAGG